MPINIDGSSVTDITIDGDPVQEVTIDGSVAWTSFAPSDIASLAHHYDATMIGLSNGDNVGGWSDLEGSVDMTQNTTSQRPEFVTNNQNGEPVVHFDAANTEFLDGAWVSSETQPNTICMAVEFDTTAGSEYLLDGFDVDRHAVWSSGDPDLNLFAGTTLDIPYAGGAFDIYTFIFDGVNSVARANGTEVGTGDAGTSAWDGMTMASRYNAPDDSGEAYIGEVCCFFDRLTATEIADMESYLGDKWGVTV